MMDKYSTNVFEQIRSCAIAMNGELELYEQDVSQTDCAKRMVIYYLRFFVLVSRKYGARYSPTIISNCLDMNYNVFCHKDNDNRNSVKRHFYAFLNQMASEFYDLNPKVFPNQITERGLILIDRLANVHMNRPILAATKIQRCFRMFRLKKLVIRMQSVFRCKMAMAILQREREFVQIPQILEREFVQLPQRLDRAYGIFQSRRVHRVNVVSVPRVEPRSYSTCVIVSTRTVIEHPGVIETTRTVIEHPGVIETTRTVIEHPGVIETSYTVIEHPGVIETSYTVIEHPGVIETSQTVIEHPGVIETTRTLIEAPVVKYVSSMRPPQFVIERMKKESERIERMLQIKYHQDALMYHQHQWVLHYLELNRLISSDIGETKEYQQEEKKEENKKEEKKEEEEIFIPWQ